MAETLGPYTLDKRIGSGGMADVYLARGPMGVCVVKRPHAHLCANPEFLRMFLDEAALLAQLHHPGIAQIYDLGHVGNVYFLSMEYVPGFDLMTISIEHERHGELMPPELCARLVADAAGALHSAHTAVGRDGQPLSIIHRDVSPHNVLLSTTGVVKLIDFGVARASSATHRTQAGLVKGKYPYMAPEQITGQTIDHRVDVYALGLVLYELLTNTRAIAGDSEVVQIDNARSSRIRPVEQLRPNVPTGLRQILSRALQPEVEQRYVSAQTLKDDLEAWLAYEGHKLGQEDLLRLFRVVAADLQQLPKGADVDLSAMHFTEREHPAQAMMVAEGLTDDVASDPALGAANTEPSMKQAVPPGARATDVAGAAPIRSGDTGAMATPHHAGQPPSGAAPIPLTPSQQVGPGAPAKPPAGSQPGAAPVAPASKPSAPAARGANPWPMIAALAAVVLALAGLAWNSKRNQTTPVDEPPAVVDAGTLVAVVTPPVPVVEDAGAEAPASDPRIASIPVFSSIPATVFVDGKRYGKTPFELELAAGTYVVTVVNREEFLRWSQKLTVKPGERRVLTVEPGKATLSVQLTPFGLIRVDGQAVSKTPLSFKEISVYEGTHDLEFTLQDGGKSKTQKARVTVRAGETKTVEHRFELPL